VRSAIIVFPEWVSVRKGDVRGGAFILQSPTYIHTYVGYDDVAEQT